MTIILTISCKEGIIMFADKCISRKIHGEYRPCESRSKLIPINNVVCSYHGFANTSDGEPLIDAIPKLFVSKNNTITVHEAANIILNFLNNQKILERCKEIRETGLHLAGFDLLTNEPIVYHIFAKIYPDNKELLVAEWHNKKCHDITGTERPQNKKYFALFNGTNELEFQLQRKLKKDYSKINFSEAIKIAKENLAITHKQHPDVCGNIINYITIHTTNKQPIISEMREFELAKLDTIPEHLITVRNKEDYDKFKESLPEYNSTSGSFTNAGSHFP